MLCARLPNGAADRTRIWPLRYAIATLSLLGALAPAAAIACSPAPGYRVPTNLELAGQANLIVLGEVVGAVAPAEDEPFSAGIAVEPVAAVKGLMPTGRIVLREMMLAGPDDTADARPSDPRELFEPHPQALAGGCIRHLFAQGARVLFFLERRDGEWRPAGGPFSRWAEDVSGPEAPWMQLAALYAHASQLEPEEQRALLVDQAEALQARTDNDIALLMGGDIERQLAGPNEPLVPAALPPIPEDAPDTEMEPEIGEFREPDDLAAVQRALDAMRAGRD